MCTVHPSRISPSFNDAALREVVENISRQTETLEIIDFTVELSQLPLIPSLFTLANVLNFLKEEKIDIGKVRFSIDIIEAAMLNSHPTRPTQTISVELAEEMLTNRVDECHKASVEKQKLEGYIKLERGYASILSPGIDVAFQSRYPWAGVMPFRANYSKKMNSAHINTDLLVGTMEISSSTSRTRTILDELLAYQFASLSPSPTELATRTSRAMYEAQDGSVRLVRSIFCSARHTREIYYYFEVEHEAATTSCPTASRPAPAAPVAAPTPVAVAPTSFGATSIHDEPIKAIDTVHVIITQKLRKKIDDEKYQRSAKHFCLEAEANSWLATVVAEYAQRLGSSLSSSQLLDNCGEAFEKAPLYEDAMSTAPFTKVPAKVDIISTEVVREDVRKLEACVVEMAQEDAASTVNIQKNDLLRLW
ncbi:3-oxoacyl-[acyl-carrier-protein] synthase [Tulasnella sp. 427]|nr:3-oxoacyl-[acyl-carrier-protein] synthase [Tulasnella sp. 427]